MTKILKNKSNFDTNKSIIDTSNYIAKNQDKLLFVRNFPSVDKEWNNIIYTYNKNHEKLIAVYNNYSSRLIKSYFSFYNMKEKKVAGIRRSRRMVVRLKRMSTYRFLLDNTTINYTNNRVLINNDIFNGREKYFKNRLIKFIKRRRINLKEIKKKLLLVKKVTIRKKLQMKIFIQKLNIMVKKNNINSDSLLVLITNKYHSVVTQYYSLISENYKDIIKKFMRKELLLLRIIGLITFNRSKFYNKQIKQFGFLLKRIFNKPIDFNFTNLKYIFLNSNIFAQSVSIKLRNRKNRAIKILSRAVLRLRLPQTDKIQNYYRNIKKTQKTRFLKRTSLININKLFSLNFNKKDKFNLLIKKAFPKSFNILNRVVKATSNKAIQGIRMESSGRLTRRLTAQRSLYKYRYKGGLRDIYSSYRSIPSVILRGNIRSNLQYTKIESKTRNGSFGLKLWMGNR